jgi:Ca2+-binding RTX toxin-like protein
VLTGGTGRNLIIGGGGADTLVGGGDDNIMVAGTTAYDLDVNALQAIMQEWTRADLSYNDRVAELSDAAFAYALTSGTVLPDGANESITPGPGEDWIFSA